jgi:hypothetical protein
MDLHSRSSSLSARKDSPDVRPELVVEIFPGHLECWFADVDT